MGFTYTDLNDLLAMTREKYPDGGKWVDLSSTSVQEYLAAPKLLKENKRKVTSGDYIAWPVQTDMGDDGGDMGLYEEVTPTQNNQMANAQIRWGGIHAGSGYDLIEMQQNAQSETRIVDLIKARRHGMRTKLYSLAEDRFWNAETTDGGKRPYSLFYWLRYAATAPTTGAFSGAYPFSGTTIAGITHARMCNWTDVYAAVSTTDLLAQLREAAFKCHFSPVPDPSILNTADQRYEIFCDWPEFDAITQLAESRNENLGTDLNKMNGRVTFGGGVFTPVPSAAAITTWAARNPFFMVDWSVMEAVFLEGFDESETTFQPEKAQPNVVGVRAQSVYNLRCLDPSRLAVISLTY